MKKLIALIAFICITVTMNAQVYLGGSLGLGKTFKSDDVTFNIYPEVGYCFNDEHSLSLVVGYGLEKNILGKENTLYISPCYTYSRMIGESNFSIDLVVGLDYIRTFEDPTNTLGLYVGPMLEYYLTDNWTIYGAFEFFRAQNTWYSDSSTETNLTFDLFDSGVKFGFYYYF